LVARFLQTLSTDPVRIAARTRNRAVDAKYKKVSGQRLKKSDKDNKKPPGLRRNVSLISGDWRRTGRL